MLFANGRYILRLLVITIFAIKVSILDDSRGSGCGSD